MSDPNDELDFTFEGENLTISFDEEFEIPAPQTPEEPEGHNCARCGEYYEYAKPNQPNGSFKCWGCRH